MSEQILKKNTSLIILDGFGLSDNKKENAYLNANTPFIDHLLKDYPMTKLKASGEYVGLPKGQMGNSEVGHLNIGAGRIVKQDLERINDAINDTSFFENEIIKNGMLHMKENKSSLHLMGLLSDGGVHSSMEHLYAILEFAKKMNIENVFIHAFLDGRDTPPTSAVKYLKELEGKIKKIGVGKISSIQGRFYAMDRDNRWDRIEKAYDLLTKDDTSNSMTNVDDLPVNIFNTANDAIKDAYENGETDEFVLPRRTKDFQKISDNDTVFFFNFRADRGREISKAFNDKDFNDFQRKAILKNLYFITMTEYADYLKNINIAFPPEKIKNTLGEYISGLNLKQLRIAETEKYAHITFFLNGGKEKENKGEDRILIPSPKINTYDLKPEMSAYEITNSVIKEIQKDYYDLIILNFANPDMVGHTGNFDASIKAIEAVDKCLKKLITLLIEKKADILISADHGNIEKMKTTDNKPITAHSTNEVPLILISEKNYSLKGTGSLPDIAPTLLELMGIKKPSEMTGKSLLIN